jgi:hypothetical protein
MSIGHGIPIVPLPPIFMRPNLQKGTDRVVITRGTTSRITITAAGSDGTSFDDILCYVSGGMRNWRKAVLKNKCRCEDAPDAWYLR